MVNKINNTTKTEIEELINNAVKLILKGKREEAKKNLERFFRIKGIEDKSTAQIYLKLGYYKEAEEIYIKLIKDKVDDPELHFHLGLSLFHQEQFLPAKECFLKAVAINPEYKKAYWYLGWCYKELGDKDKALRAFLQSEYKDFTKQIEELLNQPERKTTTSDIIYSIISRTKPKARDSILITKEEIASITPLEFPQEKHKINIIERENILITLNKGGASIYVRLYPLIYVAGSIETQKIYRLDPLEPEDTPFFPAQFPMVLLKGEGELLFTTKEKGTGFSRIYANSKTNIYIREEYLFGFVESIEWRNGTITIDEATDKKIKLVLLKGSGEVILNHPGVISYLELNNGFSVSMDLDRILGWSGRIFLKGVKKISNERLIDKTHIELLGEGRILYWV